MTLICYSKEHKMLASDSEASIAGRTSFEVNKIITPDPGEVWTVVGRRAIAFAVTGNRFGSELCRSRLRQGIYYGTPGKNAYKEADGALVARAIVVTEEMEMVQVALYDDGVHLVDAIGALTFCIGSGIQVAGFLLDGGMSPDKVIDKVKKRFHGVGGETNALKLDEWLTELTELESKLPADFVYKPDVVLTKSEAEGLSDSIVVKLNRFKQLVDGKAVGHETNVLHMAFNDLIATNRLDPFIKAEAQIVVRQYEELLPKPKKESKPKTDKPTK